MASHTLTCQIEALEVSHIVQEDFLGGSGVAKPREWNEDRNHKTALIGEREMGIVDRSSQFAAGGLEGAGEGLAKEGALSIAAYNAENHERLKQQLEASGVRAI